MSEIRGVRYAAVLEFFRAHVPDAADVGALAQRALTIADASADPKLCG